MDNLNRHDEALVDPEDLIAPAKGILVGVVLGAICWIILGGAVLLARAIISYLGN